MPIYNAPVEEMMFLFDHLKDNKNYKENIIPHSCNSSTLVTGIS